MLGPQEREVAKKQAIGPGGFPSGATPDVAVWSMHDGGLEGLVRGGMGASTQSTTAGYRDFFPKTPN
jgi:hypothetical protein